MPVILIIDARSDGLPDAVTYYRTFPLEPSPLGDMALSFRNTTAMTNSSLDTALGEMAKAGPGGIAILVCHAFQQGILLPLAPGGKSAFAVVDNLKNIDLLIAAEADAAQIRRLPTSTNAEVQIVVDRWKTLFNNLQPGSASQTFTPQEAEAFFAKVLDSIARHLEFSGTAAMQQFIARLQRVRSLALSRLELRACNIGTDKNTMDFIRTFFRVAHLTAPTVGTFYSGSVPVFTFSRELQVLQPSRQLRGRARLAGAIGRGTSRDAVASGNILALDGHTTRAFLQESILSVDFASRGIHLGPIMMFSAFTLTVDETTAFHFTVSAGVSSTGDGETPDWKKVREFVQGWIMPGSNFLRGPFPVAGFQTPDIVDLPFVLPNETSYTKLIAQSPEPTNPSGP